MSPVSCTDMCGLSTQSLAMNDNRAKSQPCIESSFTSPWSPHIAIHKLDYTLRWRYELFVIVNARIEASFSGAKDCDANVRSC